LPDQLGEAANYIRSLQAKVEKMREQKEQLLEVGKINTTMNSGPMIGFKSPEIRIWNNKSILEVVLVTGLDGQFMFNETVQVIHEEGADIVNASSSYVGDAMLHTIHAKVRICLYFEPKMVRNYTFRTKSLLQNLDFWN